jgi:2-polyprenyl-6-methoxyphenol hydroxylase-like FAD-dependent oxidoreductase
LRADATQVLVVGAGPVGLTLAMELASRGIRVTIAERRHRGEPPNVKCNHVAARSMEIFRRLGVATAVRDAGLPADYPNDIAYRITAVGEELARIPIPCRRDRFAATGGPDTWWPTAEPPHRINQLFLEPILFAHAAAIPDVTILNRTQVLDFAETPDGITAQATNLDSGAALTIGAEYIIGCDGGASTIRRRIGASFHGDAVVQRVQSTFIRAPSLLGRFRHKPAWATFSLNPRRSGTMYAIDGRETWLVHNYLRLEETEFDSVDRDLCLRQILGVGEDFSYEIISKEDWIGRRLIADRFRRGRAFICGDAAHIWVPMAGYGMNAGIADAANLAWLLAATLQGWGGPRLLEAHEAERLPITEQVSHYAMNHSIAVARQRGAVPPDIEAPGPAGDAIRARVGRDAYLLNVHQYCCGGLNFGSFYADSPIIAHDGPAPAYSMYDFTPTTVPGCRTPHVQLMDGRPLYDALGPWFTLLRRDPGVDAAPLLAAARQRDVPLALLDLAPEEAGVLYREALVLSRPDQHVAWRGNALPDDPLALVDLIRGTA